MKNVIMTLAIIAAMLGSALFAAPAQAQATRTWVSGVGDDVNPCSRTAPCKTFAGAISKTASPGEINCLDPGGFGAVTITKSITIDCHEVFASILHSGVNGVVIAFDSFAATGGSVRLRNLNFNGAGTTLGINSVRILGGAQATNSKVSIEDCLMDGNSGRGVSDERTAAATGARLNVKNCTIRNMGGAGIGVSGGSAVKVSID